MTTKTETEDIFASPQELYDEYVGDESTMSAARFCGEMYRTFCQVKIERKEIPENATEYMLGHAFAEFSGRNLSSLHQIARGETPLNLDMARLLFLHWGFSEGETDKLVETTEKKNDEFEQGYEFGHMPRTLVGGLPRYQKSRKLVGGRPPKRNSVPSEAESSKEPVVDESIDDVKRPTQDNNQQLRQVVSKSLLQGKQPYRCRVMVVQSAVIKVFPTRADLDLFKEQISQQSGLPINYVDRAVWNTNPSEKALFRVASALVRHGWLTVEQSLNLQEDLQEIEDQTAKPRWISPMLEIEETDPHE